MRGTRGWPDYCGQTFARTSYARKATGKRFPEQQNPYCLNSEDSEKFEWRMIGGVSASLGCGSSI